MTFYCLLNINTFEGQVYYLQLSVNGCAEIADTQQVFLNMAALWLA